MDLIEFLFIYLSMIILSAMIGAVIAHYILKGKDTAARKIGKYRRRYWQKIF